MRITLPLAALLLVVCWLAVSGASAAPLMAGTAAGLAPVVCKTYELGVHVPALDMAVVGAAPYFNATAPYGQWPDPGLVRGHRPAMCRQIVIPWSRQRN